MSEVGKWELGKDGPLKVTYPATVGKGQKDVRDVRADQPHPSMTISRCCRPFSIRGYLSPANLCVLSPKADGSKSTDYSPSSMAET